MNYFTFIGNWVTHTDDIVLTNYIPHDMRFFRKQIESERHFDERRKRWTILSKRFLIRCNVPGSYALGFRRVYQPDTFSTSLPVTTWFLLFKMYEYGRGRQRVLYLGARLSDEPIGTQANIVPIWNNLAGALGTRHQYLQIQTNNISLAGGRGESNFMIVETITDLAGTRIVQNILFRHTREFNWPPGLMHFPIHTYRVEVGSPREQIIADPKPTFRWGVSTTPPPPGGRRALRVRLGDFSCPSLVLPDFNFLGVLITRDSYRVRTLLPGDPGYPFSPFHHQYGEAYHEEFDVVPSQFVWATFRNELTFDIPEAEDQGDRIHRVVMYYYYLDTKLQEVSVVEVFLSLGVCPPSIYNNRENPANWIPEIRPPLWTTPGTTALTRHIVDMKIYLQRGAFEELVFNSPVLYRTPYRDIYWSPLIGVNYHGIIHETYVELDALIVPMEERIQ
ncbi:MAG: hypothetical protein DDT19_01086 [Syntrophomonadaceae bacterium]|nr:hypothetical protein [Bacillota bacterium]